MNYWLKTKIIIPCVFNSNIIYDNRLAVCIYSDMDQTHDLNKNKIWVNSNNCFNVNDLYTRYEALEFLMSLGYKKYYKCHQNKNGVFYNICWIEDY